MIETKVPKDVRSYKTKIVGPLTMRQLVCAVAAVVLDAIIYFGLKSAEVSISMETAMFAIIFLNLPILAFILEPQGMPMEKYLQAVVLPGFLRPNKRKAVTLLYEDQKRKPLAKKEKEARMKQINHVGSKNPDLKPYL